MEKIITTFWLNYKKIRVALRSSFYLIVIALAYVWTQDDSCTANIEPWTALTLAFAIFFDMVVISYLDKNYECFSKLQFKLKEK